MTMKPTPISELFIKLDPPKRKWGNWIFRSSILTLQLKAKNYNTLYEVDLERINSTADMLDWIFQVNCKWCKEGNIEDLIDALHEIFNPQANCCSRGKEKEFSGSKLAKAYAKRLKDEKQKL